MTSTRNEVDLERGIMSPSKQNQNFNLLGDPSQSSSPSSTSASALVLTASGKRIDQAGKKKYVKQVTGRHNDTELHLAAQRGDLAAVKQILDEINSQMVGTLSGADFDAEVAEIRASVVNEVNELGETALYTASEKGHLEVVKELLKYTDKEALTRRSRLEFDTLHIAASHGHHAIVKLLLDHDISLCQTRSQGNATPLITASSKGHVAVVQELLLKDPSLLFTPRSNGKNALHLAARSGHVETLKTLLEKDPQLARKTDKKGQTALHMAVKGASSEVVQLLLEADAAIVMLPDKSGFTALHVATRKKRAEMTNGESVKDMTSKFDKLAKFEGQDFRRWQKKMHFLLTTLKVVYVLSTPMPEFDEHETLEVTRRRSKWENDDYICRGHILNGMSDSLFDVYQNVESAKALWNSLESKYMAEDASSKKFLVGNFMNYKMVDTRPVMEQFHELLRILGQFVQHNLKMDEAISVAMIIDKLPPSWKEFKHTLKHSKEELNLIQLGSHFRIEEALITQELDNNPKGKNQVGNSSINMVEGESSKKFNKSNNNKRKNKGGDDKSGRFKKPKLECWKCGKPGHMKKDCRVGKGKKDGAGPSGSKDPEKQQG